MCGNRLVSGLAFARQPDQPLHHLRGDLVRTCERAGQGEPQQLKLLVEDIERVARREALIRRGRILVRSMRSI